MSLRAFTCINANAVSCVCLRACSRVGLIKTQNAFARKKIAKLKHSLGSETSHFVSRNFQDVLYMPTSSHIHVRMHTNDVT